MEDWQLDFEWLGARHWFQSRLGLDKLPDLQGILLLIGIQELGQLREDFSKEEKQDLMHIAVCRLLSYEGYYELEGYDSEGWPHWRALGKPEERGPKAQEQLLQKQIIRYIDAIQNEDDNLA